MDAHIALAGPANKQGRIAADNICGIPSTFDGSLGSSVLKVFDLTVASCGLSAKGASAAGIDFDYVLLSPPSHATYYPGSNVIRMKVLFESGTGRILGAQAVGKDGVEKRIDVIATGIHARMTGHDLAELDLAYAPPFSSAKDPVNMAGFMISNIVDGLVEQVHWDRALNLQEGEVLLDVRTPAERGKGCISGTLHIPVDELRSRLGELPKEKRILVHCQSGVRSYIACRILTQHGFDCANVAGGWAFYVSVYQSRQQDGAGKGSCGL
jgi:rhodanese-related sulfurtransferase